MPVSAVESIPLGERAKLGSEPLPWFFVISAPP
jgi:hypothetical protein